MHYLMSISYDGSKFYGFQRLKNYDTVQKKLEEALSLINKKAVTIKGAGRTDRGVHALDQKATFDLDIAINPKNLQKALNSLIEPYIYVTNIIEVNNDKKLCKIILRIDNFQNFVSGSRNNFECIIYNINFKIKDNILEIKFIGKSFYRYMVRNLVGAMLDVSRGKASLEDVKEALANPLISKRFTTAIPNGLYLNKIYY